MAKAYTSYLPDSQTATLAMRYTSNYNIPNANSTGATLSFAMAPTFSKVEQVIAFININTSPALTCNQIELTSPSGTKSILMHAANGFSSNGVLQTSIPGSRFLSNAFYGETAGGTWTLRFLDFCNSSTRTSILSSQSQTLLISGH
jgi:subtilisin-like proprotein convertase family protein